jgi:hypothetical protein
MNLEMTLQREMAQPDFRSYQYHGTLPLDQNQLRIRSVIGMDRRSLRTPVEGDASLVLSYKNFESAVISVAEQAAGEMWLLMQVQGAKSRKSYRVSSGMSWHKALADRLVSYASHPDAADTPCDQSHRG